MPVLYLEDIGRQRVRGETVDKVTLSLEKSPGRRLSVSPLEVIPQAHEARVLLQGVQAVSGNGGQTNHERYQNIRGVHIPAGRLADLSRQQIRSSRYLEITDSPSPSLETTDSFRGSGGDESTTGRAQKKKNCNMRGQDQSKCTHPGQ